MAKSRLFDIPEYSIWLAMKDRCRNPNTACYPRYGGRGIYVCDRWQTNFWAFYSDMGPRPGPGYSIERRDNDGPYEPSNCHWVTASQQARNRRSNVTVMYRGRSVTLAELAEITGIDAGTLQWRKQAGFSEERLTEPTKDLIEYNGKSLTLAEWAREIDVDESALRKRFKLGWSVEKTLTTPSRRKIQNENES